MTARRPTPADIRPRPGSAFDTAVAKSRDKAATDLEQQLSRAAQRRRLAGDYEAAALAEAWLTDKRNAS